MTLWRRLVGFLGLRPNVVLMLAALVLAGTGERLWLGFAPKYLETLGAGVLVIGLFDALQILLGAVYAYPGGWLTDHWGQRPSLLLFIVLSLAGYVMVFVWHHWVRTPYFMRAGPLHISLQPLALRPALHLWRHRVRFTLLTN